MNENADADAEKDVLNKPLETNGTVDDDPADKLVDAKTDGLNGFAPAAGD